MPHPSTKRRKLDNNYKSNRVEEITFDPEARQEYLTGFHKRKQQRIQNAREAALKREKEERVQERRQIREQRKEDLVRHVAEVNAELRKQNPDLNEAESADDEEGVEREDAASDGFERPVKQIPEDEEYVDEDKYTTVTVEAMHLANGHVEEKEETVKSTLTASNERERRPKEPTAPRPKKKKIKFRYESKAERQTARRKQKMKNKAAKARRKEG